MIYKTFEQIKTKVERELDIETEDFIQPDEFREYVNDAIDIVFAEILKLGLEDEYFLKWKYMALVQGQDTYALPTDIYSNKIKKIMYRQGATLYEIKRMRSKQRFEQIEEILQYNSVTDFYRYLLTNHGSDEGITLELFPASKEDSTQNVKVWYQREPQKWTTDSSKKCDLPEIALNFLYAYVHFRVFDKEQHAGAADKKASMMDNRELMIQTLTNMVPDEESSIDMDTSAYEDFS
jgi:hypothetical protein